MPYADANDSKYGKVRIELVNNIVKIYKRGIFSSKLIEELNLDSFTRESRIINDNKITLSDREFQIERDYSFMTEFKEYRKKKFLNNISQIMKIIKGSLRFRLKALKFRWNAMSNYIDAVMKLNDPEVDVERWNAIRIYEWYKNKMADLIEYLNNTINSIDPYEYREEIKNFVISIAQYQNSAEPFKAVEEIERHFLEFEKKYILVKN
jgi:hypothetical protein